MSWNDRSPLDAHYDVDVMHAVASLLADNDRLHQAMTIVYQPIPMVRQILMAPDVQCLIALNDAELLKRVLTWLKVGDE